VGEISTAFGATACQHVAASLCFLASEETVLALSLALGRLIFDTLLDEAGLEEGAEDG
jgi:hypothetical protein